MKAKPTSQRKAELASLKSGLASDLRQYGRKLTAAAVSRATVEELLKMLEEEETSYISRQVYE